MNTHPFNILLVEDNPGDVALLKIALKKNAEQFHLEVACDGEKALQMLSHQGPYTQMTNPDLILLDLNLPKLSGHEVLEKVKNAETLKHIPIVIFTSSDYEKDIKKTYQLHGNAYIIKPKNLDELNEIIESFYNFWLKTASLPSMTS